jgi:hypothetical protein
MDDHQLCLGARNEYGSNLAGVIPSYRTYRPRGFVSFTHIIYCLGWNVIGGAVCVHRE